MNASHLLSLPLPSSSSIVRKNFANSIVTRYFPPRIRRDIAKPNLPHANSLYFLAFLSTFRSSYLLTQSNDIRFYIVSTFHLYTYNCDFWSNIRFVRPITERLISPLFYSCKFTRRSKNPPVWIFNPPVWIFMRRAGRANRLWAKACRRRKNSD